MASNVSVEPEGEPYRKISIKTTPAMSLKTILNTACEKLKIQNPDNYGLRHNRNVLDLSLSVRFANLAAGAKLVIVRQKSQGNLVRDVAIALQLEEGGRLMGSFPTTTPIWNILTHFEQQSKGTLNLTRKESVPSAEKSNNFFKAITDLAKKNQPLYVLPVCIFMNQEYSSIEALKSTTLEKAGLTSGNGVIRVLFRFTDKTLQQMMPEIEKAVVVEGATPSAPAQTATATASMEFVKPKRISSLVADAPAAPTTTPATTTPTQSRPSSATGPTPASQQQTPQQHQPQEPKEERPSQQSEPMDVDQVHERSNSEESLTSTPESGSPQFSRDTRAFRPPLNNVPVAARIELPDSFFELTPTELKFLVEGQKARRAYQDNAPLKTRAMREREAEIRRQKYPKTMIRVRFPDRTTLQSTFLSGEKLSTLFQAVKSCLATPERKFYLYVTPPRRVLSDTTQTFWKEGLAPASLVYFNWEDDGAVGQVLSDEWISRMEDYPLPQTDVGAATAPPPTQIGASGASGNADSGASGSSSPGLARPDSAAATSASSSGASGDSGKKVPKWFKLGELKGILILWDGA
ncbi:Tether containing UBX domain for GLUT4 [Quaeritorhiza haematococci]|nr:Tether containing UBX domain for GLUT4 [Quaeritorhiza haematococci]